MQNKLILLALTAGITLAGCASTRPPAPAHSEQSKPLATEALSMKTVYDFLQECGVYYIATQDGDQPRVRPFGTAAIYEGKLYIQTGKSKNVGKQLMANPKAEICAYNQKTSAWLRIETTLVPDERVEAKQFVLDKYPTLKSMYSAADDNTLILYMTNATATFYSFGGEPRAVRF